MNNPIQSSSAEAAHRLAARKKGRNASDHAAERPRAADGKAMVICARSNHCILECGEWSTSRHDKTKAAGRDLRWRKHRHMHRELKTTLLQRKFSDSAML
jgi:hypothetical protein